MAEDLTCNLCNPARTLKNANGHRGHMRLKHGLEVAAPAPEVVPSVPVTGPQPSLQDLDRLALRVQDGLAALLEDIPEAVVAQLKQETPAHPIGLCLDKTCQPCNDQITLMTNEYRQEGRDALDAEHRKIPKVKEALEFHEMMMEPVDGII